MINNIHKHRGNHKSMVTVLSTLYNLLTINSIKHSGAELQKCTKIKIRLKKVRIILQKLMLMMPDLGVHSLKKIKLIGYILGKIGLRFLQNIMLDLYVVLKHFYKLLTAAENMINVISQLCQFQYRTLLYSNFVDCWSILPDTLYRCI